MLSFNESLKILKETDALLEGHFILSSGLHSDQYIQCAKLLSNPEKLSEKIKDKFNHIDIILSPAIGGIVVGYEIGRQLSLKTIFVERPEKKLILRRGFEIPEKSKVLIVEDVITTGKSVLECAEIIKDNKSEVLGYACIIDRRDEKSLLKGEITSQIKLKINTYIENEIPDKLKKIKPLKPGSRKL